MKIVFSLLRETSRVSRGLAAIGIFLSWLAFAGKSAAHAAPAAFLPLSAVVVQHADLSAQRGEAKVLDVAEIAVPLPPVIPAAKPAPAPVQARPDYGVFGSVAVPIGGLPAQKYWNSVAPAAGKRGGALRCDGADAGCATDLRAIASGLTMPAPGEPVQALLATVNRRVNRSIAYTPDITLYGERDHWATVEETARFGRGDCEDFAIAKMAVLAELGVPAENMQLVVVEDLRRKLFHAVLAVHLDGRSYVLDNVRDWIVEDGALADYQPLFSFSGEKTFLHGFSVKGPARVSSHNPFSAAISPGLGAPDTSKPAGRAGS